MIPKDQIFYIVATPIGNLEDITYRAINVLSNVDIVLCEDTRVTKKLFDRYSITTHRKSYHAQSLKSKENNIIKNIQQGTLYALVSDAGTPTISDPGVKLISRIRKECPHIAIISIPGACALVTALSTTGFTGNQFTFYGFLPQKKGRLKIFDEIEYSHRISIFYESPHRLIKTLGELKQRLGNTRKLCVSRELTKIYEESPIYTAHEMYHYFSENKEKIKGECVIVVDTK